MARVQTVTVTCDWCGKETDHQSRFSLTRGTKTVKLDLCAEHDTQFVVVFTAPREGEAQPVRAKRVRRPNVRDSKPAVTTTKPQFRGLPAKGS